MLYPHDLITSPKSHLQIPSVVASTPEFQRRRDVVQSTASTKLGFLSRAALGTVNCEGNEKAPPHTLPKIAPCSLVLTKYDTAFRAPVRVKHVSVQTGGRQQAGRAEFYSVCARGAVWTCGPLSEPAGKGQVPAILPRPGLLLISAYLFLSTNSCDGPRS